MTIDQLIGFLQKQKEVLGGDAPVTATWDSALSDLDHFGVQNGALIFDVSNWGSSNLTVELAEVEQWFPTTES